MVNATFSASTGWTHATPTGTGYTRVMADIRPVVRRYNALADLVAAAEELRAAFLEYEAAWQ